MYENQVNIVNGMHKVYIKRRYFIFLNSGITTMNSNKGLNHSFFSIIIIVSPYL